MPMTPTGRLLAGATMVAVVVAGAVAAGVMLQPSPAARYLTVQARVANLEQTVLATGVLEPYTLVNVGARVSGQLVKLSVKVGDTVKAGQLIGQIDSLPQQNTLRNAHAALASARAQRLTRVAVLTQAERVFARQRQMFEADATPRENYEAADAALETARAELAALDAQIEQATIAVDIARLDLDYTRVSAPISGVVVAVVTEEGRTVNANQSAPTIVMLARLDTMKVKAEISEADVTRVRPGQQVYFTTLSEPDKRYQATLRTVEPAPTSIANKGAADGAGASTSSSATTAVYYNGLFDVPNPDGELRASMTVQVHIILGQVRDALLIPLTALGERGDDGSYRVRVLDAQGVALERRVQVGMNDKTSVQVLSGVQEGDAVVVGDAALATPGGLTPWRG